MDQFTSLETVWNKRPLLTIAMALFGEGSFIQTRAAYPKAYENPANTSQNATGACVDQAPLGFLFGPQNIDPWTYSFNPIFTCITNNGGGVMGTSLITWLQKFQFSPGKNDGTNNGYLASTFTAAAFLANQAWMGNVKGKLEIHYDMGADIQIPSISQAGIILISILLGLDILILLPLAVYASSFLRWTSQLDSFAMMRIGGTVADKVPLHLGRKTDSIQALDHIPGWIGDQSEKSELVGKLALGGSRPLALRKNRRFESYEEDHEKPTNRVSRWRSYYVP
jgi:hypothetical protein